MKAKAFNATDLFYPNKNPKLRLAALWYFTVLLVAWTVLGHTVLGFEQSWATPVVAVGTGVFVQMFLEWVDATAKNRETRFGGGVGSFFNFLPAALIPSLACGMLLYPNSNLWPVVFATTLAIASKVLFRAPIGRGYYQHIFNPSNFGIAMTLVIFPQVGFAPPYHFTENLTGGWHWIIPAFILATGLVIHSLFTGRLALVGAWIIGFVLQGVLRAWYFGAPFYVPLTPMSSAAFIVFTLYMVPDPATTPIDPRRQAAFGFSVAMVYGVIQVLHLVFGLFFALLTVCAIRGIALHVMNFMGVLPAAPARARVATTTLIGVAAQPSA